MIFMVEKVIKLPVMDKVLGNRYQALVMSWSFDWLVRQVHVSGWLDRKKYPNESFGASLLLICILPVLRQAYIKI
jgi:hypothetical protein